MGRRAPRGVSPPLPLDVADEEEEATYDDVVGGEAADDREEPSFEALFKMGRQLLG